MACDLVPGKVMSSYPRRCARRAGASVFRDEFVMIGARQMGLAPMHQGLFHARAERAHEAIGWLICPHRVLRSCLEFQRRFCGGLLPRECCAHWARAMFSGYYRLVFEASRV